MIQYPPVVHAPDAHLFLFPWMATPCAPVSRRQSSLMLTTVASHEIKPALLTYSSVQYSAPAPVAFM